MFLRTKLTKMKEWPTPGNKPNLPSYLRKKSATPGTFNTAPLSNKSGKDNRPWTSTKVAAYDKQT